jgi:CRP-like cAMP-binding protein
VVGTKLTKIMPEKISRAVKHKALALTAKGKKQSEVAASLGICGRTIGRARSKLRRHGDIEGGRKKAGSTPKLSSKMEDVFQPLSL